LFTQFFFSPFEEPFSRIDYVVPRDVDLFFSKANLKEDFFEFPIPWFYKELEINRKWRAFTKTEYFEEMNQNLDLGRVVDEIRTAVADIPFLDPLEDVVGRELAVAANLRSEETGPSELPFTFLVFIRGTWKAKLAYELFNRDFLRGMAGDPLLENSRTFNNSHGYTTLVMGDERQFFMRRCQDLILFGDDEALMQQVCDLINQDMASLDLSIGGSYAWDEKVSSVPRPDSAYLDFHTNVKRIFNRVDIDEAWKANEIDFSVMTAVDIFDPDFMKDITGTIRLGSFLDLDAKVEFDTELVSKSETGFFNLESVPIKEKLDFLAKLLPADAFFAGCAKMDLEPLLKIMDRNLDPELKKIILDLIREGRRYNRQWDITGMWDFIERLDATFHDMVYVGLRPRDVDKPIVKGIQPIPILALVLEIKNMDHYKNLEKTVVEMQYNNRQSFGMWQYKELYRGCRLKGINTTASDDIEQIAYTVLDDRYFILTTSSAFLEDMLDARATPSSSLKNAPKYRPASEFIRGHGNLACFLETEGLNGALHNYAVYWADQISYVDSVELAEERKKIRDQIIRREYPQYAGREELPPRAEKGVEKKVDDAMNKFNKDLEEETIPRLTEEFRKELAWIDLLDSLILVVNINRTDLDLGLRLSSLFSQTR
jgi:hypothetical protein